MGPTAGRPTDAEHRRDDPPPEGRALTLVVDASIGVTLALTGGRPRELADETLIAPPLMWSEAASALHELGFRGELDADVATSAIAALSKLGIERADAPGLQVEAAGIARTL